MISLSIPTITFNTHKELDRLLGSGTVVDKIPEIESLVRQTFNEIPKTGSVPSDNHQSQIEIVLLASRISQIEQSARTDSLAIGLKTIQNLVDFFQKKHFIHCFPTISNPKIQEQITREQIVQASQKILGNLHSFNYYDNPIELILSLTDEKISSIPEISNQLFSIIHPRMRINSILEILDLLKKIPQEKRHAICQLINEISEKSPLEYKKAIKLLNLLHTIPLDEIDELKTSLLVFREKKISANRIPEILEALLEIPIGLRAPTSHAIKGLLNSKIDNDAIEKLLISLSQVPIDQQKNIESLLSLYNSTVTNKHYIVKALYTIPCNNEEKKSIVRSIKAISQSTEGKEIANLIVKEAIKIKHPLLYAEIGTINKDSIFNLLIIINSFSDKTIRSTPSRAHEASFASLQTDSSPLEKNPTPLSLEKLNIFMEEIVSNPLNLEITNLEKLAAVKFIIENPNIGTLSPNDDLAIKALSLYLLLFNNPTAPLNPEINFIEKTLKSIPREHLLNITELVKFYLKISERETTPAFIIKLINTVKKISPQSNEIIIKEIRKISAFYPKMNDTIDLIVFLHSVLENEKSLSSIVDSFLESELFSSHLANNKKFTADLFFIFVVEIIAPNLIEFVKKMDQNTYPTLLVLFTMLKKSQPPIPLKTITEEDLLNAILKILKNPIGILRELGSPKGFIAHILDFIFMNYEIFKLSEDHPVTLEAFGIIGIIGEGLRAKKNHYFIHKKLLEKKAEKVDLRRLHFSLNSIEIDVDFEKILGVVNPKNFISISQLQQNNSHISSKTFRKLFNNFRERINALSKREQETVSSELLGYRKQNESINENPTAQSIFASLERTCTDERLSISYWMNYSSSNPEAKAPIHLIALYAILNNILTKPTTLNPGDIFSEQERALCGLAHSIENCLSGQSEGILKVYKVLLKNTALPTVIKPLQEQAMEVSEDTVSVDTWNREETSFDSISTFVSSVIEENILTITDLLEQDGPLLRSLIPDNEGAFNQLPHQSIYLKNLLKADLFLNHSTILDMNGDCIDIGLQEKTKQDILEKVAEHFIPQLIETLQTKANQTLSLINSPDLESQRNARKFYNALTEFLSSTDTFELDEETLTIKMHNTGIFLLLEKLEYLTQIKSSNKKRRINDAVS